MCHEILSPEPIRAENPPVQLQPSAATLTPMPINSARLSELPALKPLRYSIPVSQSESDESTPEPHCSPESSAEPLAVSVAAYHNVMYLNNDGEITDEEVLSDC
jgi:hypothetical protein